MEIQEIPLYFVPSADVILGVYQEKFVSRRSIFITPDPARYDFIGTGDESLLFS